MPFFIWHNLPGSDESQIQALVGAETQESLVCLFFVVVALQVFTKIFSRAALYPPCPGLCRPSAWRNYKQQASEQKVTSKKGILCLPTPQFHTLVEKDAQWGFLLRQHPDSKLKCS